MGTPQKIDCQILELPLPKKQIDNELRYHQIVGIQDIDPLRQDNRHQNPAKYASKKAPETLFRTLPPLPGSHIIIAKISPPTPFGWYFVPSTQHTMAFWRDFS